MTIQELASKARQHASEATADLKNSSTRIETLRLSRLAIQAEQLADGLEELARNAASDDVRS